MERREALARQDCSVRMLGEFSLRGGGGGGEGVEPACGPCKTGLQCKNVG